MRSVADSKRGRSLLTGVTGGFFSGLTGVGGGIVMVPLLTGLLRLPQHLAHGTSLAIVIFVASAGLAGYWLTGNIDWELALWLALGSASGSYLGATAMTKVAPQPLKLLFGLFLMGIAIRMFFA